MTERVRQMHVGGVDEICKGDCISWHVGYYQELTVNLLVCWGKGENVLVEVCHGGMGSGGLLARQYTSRESKHYSIL
jgi:hypothetical protein